MCASTLNRQRLSNTRTLTPTTLQASGKASSKAKSSGFLELTLQRRNLTNTSHYSNKDCNTGVIHITFWTGPSLKSISAKEYRLYKTNKKRAKEFCRLLQNTAHQCLISNIFLWTNGMLYKTSSYYEKYSKTVPLFHIEKGGLWKMYSSEQNSEVSEFPILTNWSRVWPVYTL